jgi:hypothetical protein
MTGEENEFDFDAMVMFGWVADRKGVVRRVNRSLGHWLRTDYVDREALPDFTTDGVEVALFLRSLLEIPEELENTLIERIGTTSALVSESDFAPDPLRTADAEIVSFFQRTDCGRVLCGWRCVSVAGVPMRGGDPRPLVDLVIVCKTEAAEGGHRIIGYQGQFLDAWLRVRPIVREGTRSGAVALMGRNLSHNIGSHALYWLEQEEPETVEGLNRARFLRYLRERMELLAGFATGISTSPRTVRFDELVKAFSNNKLLTEHLCKSEDVTTIRIDMRPSRKEYVALPGGALGAQAFFSLLENVLRDNAKYGAHSKVLRVAIQIEADSAFEDYWRVRILDDKADDSLSGGERIAEALSNLQISDLSGGLQPGAWGIKERFIAAAFLRGIRVEDIAEEAGDTWVPNLNRERPSEPPILSISGEQKRLEWVFYLLKPKEILLILGGPTPEVDGDSDGTIDHHDFQWLKDNLTSVGAVRHRIAAIQPRDEMDRQWLAASRAQLPLRTLLVDDLNAEQPGAVAAFPRLSASMPALSCDALYRSWVETLDPDLGDRFVLVHTLAECFQLDWKDRACSPVTAAKVAELVRDPNCLGLFDHHAAFHCNVAGLGLHYECFTGTDSLVSTTRRAMSGDVRDFSALFEAALVRIVIVDERLDQSAETAKAPELRLGGWSLKRLFAAKGVDLYGREFSRTHLPEASQLLDLARRPDGGRFHFMCVHRGILDKLKRPEKPDAAERVLEELARRIPYVIVHSGRAGAPEFQASVRHMPLSNVADWLHANRDKTEIVDVLSQLRRV